MTFSYDNGQENVEDKTATAFMAFTATEIEFQISLPKKLFLFVQFSTPLCLYS